MPKACKNQLAAIEYCWGDLCCSKDQKESIQPIQRPQKPLRNHVPAESMFFFQIKPVSIWKNLLKKQISFINLKIIHINLSKSLKNRPNPVKFSAKIMFLVVHYFKDKMWVFIVSINCLSSKLIQKSSKGILKPLCPISKWFSAQLLSKRTQETHVSYF